MRFSEFGEKFSSQAGIISLMDDLGNAMASGGDLIMMGGGNPAHIPEVEEVFRQRLREILESPSDFRRLIGTYDPPQGELEFIRRLAAMLRREFGWSLSERNIALTNGSQSAFFMLFNLFAGRFSDGSRRKIQLPMAPEYIGYADAGLTHDFFRAAPPRIELLGDQLFKYRVDFQELQLGEETGALCVSRPTNPTGNVLTDGEIDQLLALAERQDVPLILDGAYGAPFPNLIFSDISPRWDERMILCLSLSKLGLPAVRTGIVIAREDIIRALSGVNAILNLATGSFGAMLASGLLESGEILRLSRDRVRPFYQAKAQRAVDKLRRELQGYPCFLHKPEGAMFLWLWLKDLPISSQRLYERLKARGVLVVSGHYFFPGLDPAAVPASEMDGGSWRHTQECIRITYSQDDDKVMRGLEIIAEEARRAYGEAGITPAGGR